jgi:hypothetical protein
MGKHETRYARIERDLYPTPAWLIAALAEHVDFRNLFVWQCACGDGRMSEALKLAGCARVYSTKPRRTRHGNRQPSQWSGREARP